MNQVLAGLSQQLDALDEEARSLAERYPAAALAERPRNGGWSVAECWAHVAKTVGAYLPKLDEGIHSGRAEGLTGEGPYSHGIVGRVFLWALEPPARLKVRAPGILKPEDSPDPHAALADYLAKHQALRERMRASDGLDLGKVKVTSPATDKLVIPLVVAFGAMTAHGRRHAWQARRVLKVDD